MGTFTFRPRARFSARITALSSARRSAAIDFQPRRSFPDPAGDAVDTGTAGAACGASPVALTTCSGAVLETGGFALAALTFFAAGVTGARASVVHAGTSDGSWSLARFPRLLIAVAVLLLPAVAAEVVRAAAPSPSEDSACPMLVLLLPLTVVCRRPGRWCRSPQSSFPTAHWNRQPANQPRALKQK